MLTHDAVRSAAAALGLGAYADGLVEARRPVYRLDAAPNGAHRIGGVPDLVDGGGLYVVIPAGDLAAHRYDRAVALRRP